MRVAVFGTKPYDRAFFSAANREFGHELVFIENPLNPETAPLAAGAPAVCAFVNDDLSAATLEVLKNQGTGVVALRSAGYNNADLAAASRLGLVVVHVPAYSPHGVAEHAVALLLTLVRKTHKAYARVREGNFALDGLLGHDLHGLTVGVVGTGQIGAVFARIMSGFGCRILAHDVLSRLLTFPNVLITGHQAFFTREALEAIARTTLQNLRDEASGRPSPNRVKTG